MKANEFCYWLQGYFEIGDTTLAPCVAILPSALRCIRAHLDLVLKVEPEHSNVFVAWLSERVPIGATTSIDEAGVREIRRFLGAQFQHVIDPGYGGDQKELGKIHGTIHGTIGGSWPGDGLVRC